MRAAGDPSRRRGAGAGCCSIAGRAAVRHVSSPTLQACSICAFGGSTLLLRYAWIFPEPWCLGRAGGARVLARALTAAARAPCSARRWTTRRRRAARRRPAGTCSACCWPASRARRGARATRARGRTPPPRPPAAARRTTSATCPSTTGRSTARRAAQALGRVCAEQHAGHGRQLSCGGPSRLFRRRHVRRAGSAQLRRAESGRVW